MAEHELKDADISRGCRQNDSQAWRYLVRLYTPLVYRIARRMLRSQQEAEDTTQEVFLRVHRSIMHHDPTRPLAPWLARITYNECLKRLSKTKQIGEKELALYEDDLPDGDTPMTPESHTNSKQVSEQIVRALDRLSIQDRALVIMRYREGFSDSEIAEATNMPVGTVKTRLHRARGRLRKWLAPLFKEVSI